MPALWGRCDRQHGEAVQGVSEEGMRGIQTRLRNLRNDRHDFEDWDRFAGSQQRAVQDIERIVASWTDEERADMIIVGGPKG